MIDDYLAGWLADKIVGHDAVQSATAIGAHQVEIVRKQLPPITVVPVRSDVLELADVAAILDEHQPTLIVLVNRDGHYAWDARELAQDRGASVQTVSELYTFLSDDDPRQGLDKGVAFVLSRLEQHTRISRVENGLRSQHGGLPQAPARSAAHRDREGV